MNIVFFGNTKYSTIVLDVLHKEFGINTIITLPPRVLGRKKVPTPNPVHKFAKIHDIPVKLVEQFNNETLKQLQDVDVDFFVVTDYGLILPKNVLSIPKIAPLNVHHSLLPKHRGPSPVPFTILNGDTTTGVSVIQMTEKMDAGPILAQTAYPLRGNETTDSLLTELNILGAKIILPIIKNYNSVKPQQQDDSKATYTKLFKKSDGYISPNNPPSKEQFDRMIRAYYPWPGVWTKLRMKNEELRIKFLPEEKIQVEGKKPMTYKDFMNGYPHLKTFIDSLI